MLLINELVDGRCQIQSQLVVTKEQSAEIVAYIKQLLTSELPEVASVRQEVVGPIASVSFINSGPVKSPKSDSKRTNHSCPNCKQFKTKKDLQTECEKQGKTFASSDGRKDLCDKLFGTGQVPIAKPFSPQISPQFPTKLQIPNFSLPTKSLQLPQQLGTNIRPQIPQLNTLQKPTLQTILPVPSIIFPKLQQENTLAPPKIPSSENTLTFPKIPSLENTLIPPKIPSLETQESNQ